MAYAAYRSGAKHSFPQASYHPSNRGTNQIVLSGEDAEVILAQGIFWLEQVETATGVTVKISDGDGDVIIPLTGSFDAAMSPIRCDHGIIFDGTMLWAKGFIQEDCLS